MSLGGRVAERVLPDQSLADMYVNMRTGFERRKIKAVLRKQGERNDALCLDGLALYYYGYSAHLSHDLIFASTTCSGVIRLKDDTIGFAV
jgi:hypothetical protein